MKMGGCAEMKIVKHGWRLGFRKYLVESKLERREGCSATFSIGTLFLNRSGPVNPVSALQNRKPNRTGVFST